MFPFEAASIDAGGISLFQFGRGNASVLRTLNLHKVKTFHVPQKRENSGVCNFKCYGHTFIVPQFQRGDKQAKAGAWRGLDTKARSGE